MDFDGRKVKKYAFISFLLLFCVYGGFEGYKIVRGPSININSPVDGESFTEQGIILSGSAKNIAFIRLNSRQIFVNKENQFQEKLILLAGYNIIEVEAEDRFGKKVQKKLRLYLDPKAYLPLKEAPKENRIIEAPESPVTATTTPTTSPSNSTTTISN